jgi:ABC-type transporter Mla subunit MlaD
MTRPNHKPFLSNPTIGLIAIALTVIGFYLAFTKSIPFTDGGYELKGVFADAQNIRADSPVRISGVEVGEVTEVEHLKDENGEGEDAAVVTMEIKDSALPIREDATMQLRPRLFLEGNLFVELSPGSPGAPELDSGSVVPQEPPDLPPGVRRRSGAVRRREGAAGVVPDLPRGVPLHGGGERGVARDAARGPRRLHFQLRHGRRPPRPEQRRPAGPD